MTHNKTLSSIGAIGKTLAGHYDLVGQSLRSGQNTLYIKHRKPESITKKKPQKFLILTKPKFEYISSMYPLEPNKYLIEYQDSGYCLAMSNQEASITPVAIQEVKKFVNELSGDSTQYPQSEQVEQSHHQGGLS